MSSTGDDSLEKKTPIILHHIRYIIDIVMIDDDHFFLIWIVNTIMMIHNIKYSTSRNTLYNIFKSYTSFFDQEFMFFFFSIIGM